MSLNRLLITAVVVENRPVSHVAAQYGVSRSLAVGAAGPLPGRGRDGLRAAHPTTPDQPDRDCLTTRLSGGKRGAGTRNGLEHELRPKATPGDREADSHHRVRNDRIDSGGKITLRYQGKLYSIGIGRTHARTRVLVLIQDLHIRVVDAATGELLRELVLDPSKRYQGTGRPPGPTR